MSENGDGDGRIVAVGLLTEQELSLLGTGFRRVYRLVDGHDFDDLLAAIDRAEQKAADRPPQSEPNPMPKMG